MVRFVFGRPIKNLEDFYDREELLESMINYIERGQSYALIGFRRMGKTSILNVLEQILSKRGFLTSFIDLEVKMERGYLDPVSFLRLYNFSILEDYFNQVGISIKLKHLVRETSSKIVLALSEILGRLKSSSFKVQSLIGSLELHLEFEKTLHENRNRMEVEDRLLESILRLPEVLAQEQDKRFVVFIDEFQFVRDLKVWRRGIFHTMRSIYQHQEKTTYIISGSAVGMITDILNLKEAPFYMTFMPIHVKPFSQKIAKNYLYEGFISEGFTVTEDTLDMLVQNVDGIPAWLSYIGQKCIFNANEQKTKVIDERIASDVVSKMYEDPLLIAEIEKDLTKLRTVIKTPRILKILEIMAKYDVTTPSEIAQVLSKQEGKPIPQSKILQLYLERLLQYGYVQKESRGKYTIADSILSQYLKRKTNY
ncbi:MAG: ATP-binding protein [Thermoprotei archaeon]